MERSPCPSAAAPAGHRGSCLLLLSRFRSRRSSHPLAGAGKNQAASTAMLVPAPMHSLQSMQLFNKGIDVFEIAVNGGESNVRHRVEWPQALHHHGADPL